MNNEKSKKIVMTIVEKIDLLTKKHKIKVLGS